MLGGDRLDAVPQGTAAEAQEEEKFLVAEGAEVRGNQGILVMEAMKMQNEIKSPKAGIVKRLAVSEGLAVNSGDLLASVE